MINTTCPIKSCDRPIRAAGLCDTHYRRKRKYGDPEFMHDLECAKCGKRFESHTLQSKYCSSSCRAPESVYKTKKNGPTCAECGVQMHRGKGVLPQGQARCLKCKNGGLGYFVKDGGRWSHGLSAHAQGCRCDVCVMAKREANMAYKARVKAEHGVNPSTLYRRSARGVDPDVDLSCGKCGEPVGSYRGNATPYHRNCRLPKWLLEGRQGPAQRRARALLKRAAAGTHGGRVWTVGNCSWCGDHFTSPNAKFCSRNCAKYSRDANNPHKFSISPIRRAELYERDNWTCQLCFDPVDPTLHYSDAWAATLDHIIPQSWMLIPDHSESNLQLAHRMCNSLKGDRVEMEVA